MPILVSYADGDHRRIAPLAVDDKGHLSLTHEGFIVPGCQYFEADARGRVLYVTYHDSEQPPEAPGVVQAFALETDGSATPLSRQATGGGSPCYVSLAGNSLLMVANYRGPGGVGSVATFALDAHGDLTGPAAEHRHPGGSRHPERQTCSHPHSVAAEPSGRFVFVPDLGIDRIVAYRVQADGRGLEPVPAGEAVVEPGSGPRHIAFHPTGRWVYVIMELTGQVAAFELQGDGRLTHLQTVSSLPRGYDGPAGSADLRISPDGRRLYSTNRGNQTVVGFRVHDDGRLEPAGHQPTGKTPRYTSLTPDGRFYLVANSGEGTVTCFRCEDDASLTPAGELALPGVGCMQSTADGITAS